METKLVVFQDKKIRRTLHKGEWWFVIVDVIAALTVSVDPTGYIKDMRRRDAELSKGWGQIATPLLVDTVGGKQKINCANTEGIFRIIQSVPSPAGGGDNALALLKPGSIYRTHWHCKGNGTAEC